MNDKELMVGNWVCYEQLNPYITKVEQIRCPKGGEEYYITCQRDNKDPLCKQYETDDFNIAILHPIPLTKEILERNGFYMESNTGFVLDDYDGVIVIYDEWNHAIRILVNHKTIFDKEYFDTVNVHQLQNALRICEIEKEIIL